MTQHKSRDVKDRMMAQCRLEVHSPKCLSSAEWGVRHDESGMGEIKFEIDSSALARRYVHRRNEGHIQRHSEISRTSRCSEDLNLCRRNDLSRSARKSEIRIRRSREGDVSWIRTERESSARVRTGRNADAIQNIAKLVSFDK